MKVLWLLDRDALLALPFLTATLWAMGGSGPKLFRRLGAPLAIASMAPFYGVSVTFLTAYSLCALALIGFGPGYGDSYVKRLGRWYWPYIYALGFLYGACQLPLAFQFGRGAVLLTLLASLSTSVVFGTTMVISKSKRLPWKLAEAFTGLSVGACAVTALIKGV